MTGAPAAEEGAAGRPVKEIENIWIPLPDGMRLAARLWLPEDAENNPVPLILDYIPYRKRDHYRLRDTPIYAWLAAHGYVCARVDARGCGESDGVLRGEFLRQEQDDAVELIAWLARRPWCDGKVAMQGLSWGGFSALQAAMRRPPALKAIVVIGAGHDRYDASLHYTGGCLLNEQLWVAAYYALVALRPPDPAIVGDRWREMWLERLEAHEPWLADWLDHPHRDGYWKQGSVCEDYGAINCPTLLASGWADYLSKSVPRFMEELVVPRRAIVGPWGHVMPQNGEPGEPIGFLQEALRWYDYWLKGRETGAVEEPALRYWMQPDGPWLAEESWPSPRVSPQRFELPCEAPRRHRSAQTIGLTALEWSSRPGMAGQSPRDQRPDDGQSLALDLPPLDAPLEILGAARLELDLAVDVPVAFVAARLNDVAPDGTSTRVALRVFNLAHRDGSEAPLPMAPNQRARIALIFPDQAWRFRKGHSVRVALSNVYWPVIWPSPAPVEMIVYSAALILPILSRSDGGGDRVCFSPAEEGAGEPIEEIKAAKLARDVTYDVLAGETTVRLQADGGFYGPGAAFRIERTGVIVEHAIRKLFTIRDGDPLSARSEISQSYSLARDEWRIRIDLSFSMRCDARNLYADICIEALDNEETFFRRAWALTSARVNL